MFKNLPDFTKQLKDYPKHRLLWGLFLIACTLALFPLVMIHSHNSLELDNLKKYMSSLPHPPGTVLLQRTAQLGNNLNGGSTDCCEYTVTEVRQIRADGGSWKSTVEFYGPYFDTVYVSDAAGIPQYVYYEGKYRVQTQASKSREYHLNIRKSSNLLTPDLRCFLLKPCELVYVGG